MATLTAVQVDNGSTDNCGVTGRQISKDGVNFSPILNFACAEFGPNTVTLRVNDAVGNSATCQAIITVQDQVAPTALCKNITVQLNAAGAATITGVDVDNASTDNCGIATRTVAPASFKVTSSQPRVRTF